MSRACLYLSGGMERSPDLGGQWRKLCTQNLKDIDYTTVDITAIDVAFTATHGNVYTAKDNINLLQYKSNIRKQFIYTDLRLIKDNSDAVIGYYDEAFRLGAGSFAECQAAYNLNKPLFIVSAYPTLNEIPGWLKALSTKIFFNFEELYAYLSKLPVGILKTDRYGNHSAGNDYLCGLCGDVFTKAKHGFVSKVYPLYCKWCVDIVTKTYEGQADRYDFALSFLEEQIKCTRCLLLTPLPM